MSNPRHTLATAPSNRDDAQVEIDWKGIASSARAISGGQGENILLLVTDSPVELERLNELIPNEDGEFPANGKWFAGPGGWLLLIEARSVPVKPRLEELAQALHRAGIAGTLTGAKPFRRPAWSRPIENLPRWRALLNYRQLPQYGPYDGPGWTCGTELLERVVDHMIDWATTDEAQLTVSINLKARFPFDQPTAKAVLRREAETQSVASATAYNKTDNQLRGLKISTPGRTQMSVVPAQQEWVPIIDNLRTAMRTAPLDQLSIAMIHHHGDFLHTERPDYDHHVYRSHPELWDTYTPEPCGIQILTDKHLAKANNLDDWNTTRLNEHLYLVQAKDLSPWYSQPLSYYDTPEIETTTKARADFGDMVFTHNTATQLGITRPPRNTQQ